ncbi:MAG: coiled-coil domain-containing protein [Planctomycetota bacterium]
MPPLMAVVLLALLAGCGKKASRQNDLLRARVLDLEAQVEQLTDRNRELETALGQAEAGPGTLPEEVRANIPHVVRVEIDRRSHALDEDGDGRADGLLVYVKPADGLGRFVQLVGRLGVRAVDLPPDADPVSLGQVSLGPTEVRESYRTSFLGTHYSVTLPLTLPADRPDGPCTVHVVYEDGRSGRSVDAQRQIDLRP